MGSLHTQYSIDYTVIYAVVIFHFSHIEKKKIKISKIMSKPSSSLVKFIKQLDNFNEETKDYDECLPNCQYRDFGYFQNFSQKFKSKSLSLLHLNICSLWKKFDNFCILLKEINMKFGIIALTESRIKKNPVSPIDIELENYSTEHTLTEIAAAGALQHQKKAILSSKKWFEYSNAWQIGIYFYWNCMS